MLFFSLIQPQLLTPEADAQLNYTHVLFDWIEDEKAILILVKETTSFFNYAETQNSTNLYTFIQSERAFQKQPTIFQNRKRLPGVKKGTLKRYTTAVGLGFKTPREVRCIIANFKFV